MKNTLILMLVWLLVGCAVAQENFTNPQAVSPADNMKKAKVVVYIFSGRESPSWELCSDQLSELMTMVEVLPQSDKVDFPDGLGYTGIKIIIPGQGTNEPEELFIFKDRLRRSSAGEVKYQKDEKRKIESFVIKTADGRLDAELQKIIQDAVSDRRKTSE